MSEEIWANVAATRNELADALENIPADAWDTQSLCEAWKVRDVVAHVIEAGEKMKLAPTFVALAKSGFSVDKMLTKWAIEGGKEAPETLVKHLREVAPSRNTPPGTNPTVVMTDAIVHGQDIRRPLGLGRDVPADRLRRALDFAVTSKYTGGKKRSPGLRFVATDLDWNYGAGPEVRGAGEALLMALAGRTIAIDDLTGDGVSTLRSRG